MTDEVRLSGNGFGGGSSVAELTNIYVPVTVPGVVEMQKEKAAALTFKGYLDPATQAGRDTGDAQKWRGH